MSADATELKTLMLREPRLTLAVAESLTCGRVQARVGAVSGASEYFLGGVTAYSLDQKVKLLGVDRAAAGKVNSVSAMVAEQMALGAGKLFGADIAAATTGYAEPFDSAQGGPNAEWKVAQPFAWWAVARRDGAKWVVRSGRVEFSGAARVEVQKRVAEATMAALISLLREIRG